MDACGGVWVRYWHNGDIDRCSRFLFIRFRLTIAPEFILCRRVNQPAFLRWDVVGGVSGMNTMGQMATSGLGMDVAQMRQHPVEALALATRLPDRSVLFMHNAHRYTDQAGVAQALWNLRDPYK